MRLDDADDHVHTGLQLGLRALQHLIGLADAGGGADEDLQPADLRVLAPGGFQERVRRWPFPTVAALICHGGIIVAAPRLA